MQAARDGDVDAQYAVGRAYARGEGVPQSVGEATRWLTRAAEAGHARAAYELALLYLAERPATIDAPIVETLRAAVAQGNVAAERNLDLLFPGGAATGPRSRRGAALGDARLRRRRCRSRRNLGLFVVVGRCRRNRRRPRLDLLRTRRPKPATTPPCWGLGAMLATGVRDIPDPAAAAPWYQRSAERGNATAAFYLGVQYARAEGVERDLERAVALYRQAAAKGHIRAAYSLAAMLEWGNGAQVDLHEAESLYRTAARGGDLDAMKALGDFLLRRIEPPAAEEAASCYRQAAEAGHLPATLVLAHLHEIGLGVPADPDEALRWTRLAAERDEPNAQLRLGTLHFEGRYVPRDQAEAVRWYERAAANGLPEARYNLGVCHEEGLGVARDANQAETWYRLARRPGQHHRSPTAGPAAARRRESAGCALVVRTSLSRRRSRQHAAAGPRTTRRFAARSGSRGGPRPGRSRRRFAPFCSNGPTCWPRSTSALWTSTPKSDRTTPESANFRFYRLAAPAT